MTIEQLLCPAVMMWETNFREHLNESHIEMTDDEIYEEFDKWLAENEELINKSVEDNIEHINETINRNMKKLNSLNEGIFDDDAFGDDDEKDPADADDVDDEDKPISGDVDDETDENGNQIDPDEPEENRSSLTGAVKLTDNKKSKYNIFSVINDFYDEALELHTNHKKNKAIMRKLDVSAITNMSALFAFADVPNLDLSSWVTSSVKIMEGMFYKSTFNNDSVCEWDVSGCADFKNMFLFCPFNQSLKAWTPKFVTKKFRNPDGTMEERTVRADLPIIGGTEDEAKTVAKNYHRGLFKSMRDEDGDEEMDENMNTNNNTMKHMMDFDTFINEGKFKDFVNKGVEKVKNAFKSIALKFDKIIAVFKDNGEMYPATSAYTSLNMAASGEIPGVTGFSAVKSKYLVDVPDEASVVESPEYYGIIDKDSVEYQNYLTFASMVNEHYEKYGDAGLFQLNEDAEDYKRVGFSAAEGGVNARDINSDDLREILEDLVMNVPAYKGKNHGGAVFIWGAPGIGKSTIPKAIVKSWNEKKGDDLHKKGLMVVQCGDLTIDGFSLPIPIEKTVKEYLDERPLLAKNIEKSGISDDVIERVKQNMHKVSIEAPKTWLPAYKIDSTQEELKVLNDIANGHVDIIDDENGNVIRKESNEGGILLFDEFFRANPQVFKIMMQIILNREYSGYRLGNKWGILCCSNRPKDDEEVEAGFEKTGAVVGTRMLAGAYNFIPSFDEWKKWAISEGGFDDLTIEFLMHDKDGNGEYTNWHTIRPKEYTATGKTAWPTPRTWSGFMVELNNYMENHGYANITDVPESKIRRIADGVIGVDMSAKYAGFIRAHASSIAVNAKKVLEDPKYKIPETSKCPDVTRQIENYIKIKYDSENVPDVSLLMNMYNSLNNTYSGTKDNFVKMMHANIIKFFKVMSNKATKNALKDYLQAVDQRYQMEAADLR